MKIYNLGSLNIDYVYSVPHFVQPGETLSSAKLEIFPGGKGMNQSVALAKAGARVIHGGRIGDNGGFLKEILGQAGADTSFVAVDASSTGHAMIQVDENGQTLVYPSFQREELDEEAAEEYVAPFTYEVGQSVTAGQNKLTVDGYAYDANTQCGLIYMSLEMPGGFPEYKVASNGMLVWQGQEQVRTPFGIEIFAEDVEDTRMTLAGYFYVPDYYEESEFSLYLSNGQWKNDPHLDIPLENIGGLQCITAGNSGIQIAPFAMVVHGDKLGILKENTKETNLSYLAVRYTDGSEYVILDESGEVPVMNYANDCMETGDRSDGYVTDRYCVTYLLNRIVALDEVTEVIVDGVTYTVD